MLRRFLTRIQIRDLFDPMCAVVYVLLKIAIGLSLLKKAAMTDKEFHSEASKPSKPSAELEGGPESLGNVSVEGAGNETILALYYSGDIYVQMCWWLGYTFLILCTAVWISWRLFGQEISEILLLQGYQLPEKTSRPKQNQSAPDHSEHQKSD